ncbi:hypothetical protein FQA39_LY09524 [Lamprigera yunnana]|nr:hypothetical protein FQA39_LY09524 [Lamprigera yunnana]
MKNWKFIIFLFFCHQSTLCAGDLASDIQRTVSEQLAHLEHMGDKIRQQVQQQLMPVHALAIKNKLLNGVGGTTTAKYFGNPPRNFIIQNGIRAECSGKIVGSNCDGTLVPFTMKYDEDFCFSNSYAAMNDRVCLSNGPLVINQINGESSCKSGDGSPTLVITSIEYTRMCGNHGEYVYYANPKDPNAIRIPNENPYVKCLNNDSGICYLREPVTVNHKNVGSYHSHSYNGNYYSSSVY